MSFVEAIEGVGDEGQKHAACFLHLRLILGDLAVGAVQPGTVVSIRRGSRVHRTSQWRVPLPNEGGHSRRQIIFSVG